MLICAVAKYLVHVVMSIVHDMKHSTGAMKPITDFVTTDGSFASSLSKAKSSMRTKPDIRCENCTKTQDDAGIENKFMLCSVCKSKLNFTVHYCSALVTMSFALLDLP
jgi:hypothetical protein